MHRRDLPLPGIKATFWMLGGHRETGIVREWNRGMTAIRIDPIGLREQSGFADMWIDTDSIVAWFRYKETRNGN